MGADHAGPSAQVSKRHKALRKAVGRGGENFAAVARENKRKADEAAKAEELKRARQEVGIEESQEGQDRSQGEGVEGGGVWYPLDVLQQMEQGKLPELPG